MRRAAAALVLVLAFATVAMAGGQRTPVRAMWVWTTVELLAAPDARRAFLDALAQAQISDVYLYLRADDYRRHEDGLRTLLGALAKQGVRAWGMEGWRGYFFDAEGPNGFFAAIAGMIAFNARNGGGFVGFHSDLEPQDGQGDGVDRFHNGLPDSRLTPRQRADRDGLMNEWLALHAEARARLRAAGLAYGAAVPSWVDDYEGEPVRIVQNGARVPLLPLLMRTVDEYAIMSYNTEPANVLARIGGELRQADALGDAAPRILFALETHRGAGRNVSYADTPEKANRAAVTADFARIAAAAAAHVAFAGGAIHDWAGWRDLPAGR